MTFPQYYELHKHFTRFMFPHLLPEDVREDLRKMIKNEDKRLGVYVIHASSSTNSEDGLTLAYYMRSWHPHFIYDYIFGHYIPVGLRFWSMKKVNA